MPLTAISQMNISPSLDLKPRMNKYILELWQHEWDERHDNKLHQIKPKLIIFLHFQTEEKRLFSPVYILATHIDFDPFLSV